MTAFFDVSIDSAFDFFSIIRSIRSRLVFSLVRIFRFGRFKTVRFMTLSFVGLTGGCIVACLSFH